MNISNTPVSDFDAAVRLLSGGTNVAIYNDIGLPSIYVRRDKGTIHDVVDIGIHNGSVPETTHYAFKVNGVEIPAFYMGKYLATVYKGRALSLPLQDPTTGTIAAADRGDAPSSHVTFDNAKIWCEANGAGFHLPTIAEYAWVALQSRANGTLPHGNNNYGNDYSYIYEKGIASLYDADGRICRTLTGSGPAKWNDNWQPDGICDLNGNVCEWQAGYRTVNGEIQIFADNDAAMQYAQNSESTLWKAILQDGTLVEPGAAGTLKWDYTKDPGNEVGTFRLNTMLEFPQITDTAYGSVNFADLTAADGVAVPFRLMALGLMPDNQKLAYEYGNDRAYMRNFGERFVYRGGPWFHGVDAGVFSTYGSMYRAYYYDNVGFRPAFIPGI